jgi:Flp pilus assembly protein TadG
MKTVRFLPARTSARPVRTLRHDVCGAVLIEAAILLPILLIMLVGMINYGLLFMAAHTLQEAANEGARASLAGLSDTERQTLANAAVQQSVGAANVVNPALVTVAYATSNGFYTVTVSYNIAQAKLFAATLLPMPKGPIQRASVVKLATM